jgi:Flp pilus assembly protein TadD
MAGRFEQAIEWANRALDDQPRLSYSIRAKIVANVQLGRLDEARAELGRLLERVMHFVPSLRLARA